VTLDVPHVPLPALGCSTRHSSPSDQSLDPLAVTAALRPVTGAPQTSDRSPSDQSQEPLRPVTPKPH
jgi:hypothetical protein